MTNSGNKLWTRAKSIIPGGNQLLSKRPERFLPGLWPTYFQRAKGCEVWDVDGNHYYDFAQMGVGTCILGYADDDVNTAVKSAIDKGSMCSLNCLEEIKLAERMISLHPWAEMARFTRSGGEACAVSIRIARASSCRDVVLFCGYHGWHDWYLSANIVDPTNLNAQVLKGLNPRGVPQALINTAIPFFYNDRKGFDELIAKYSERVGVIIMECMRDEGPKDGFLKRIRETASNIGAVLIFDEVTSGFRMNLGGIHMTLGVEPDIAVFGKALSNGFPIGAVIGRRGVMDAAQDSFISSTYWTERVGFTAALASLDKMEQRGVQERLRKHGVHIRQGWETAARDAGLDISVVGVESMPHIIFKYPNADAIQTLYAQQMLDLGYLVGAALYTTYAYTEAIIDGFISNSHEVFRSIYEAINEGTVESSLKGPVISFGFQRLT